MSCGKSCLCAHVSVIVSHDWWFQSVSIQTINITFCWRMMHICQYINVSSVFPCHSCQVILHPNLHITLLQSEFPSEVTRHSFSVWSDSTTAIFMAFLCKSLNK
jgi:hypothetical protein